MTNIEVKLSSSDTLKIAASPVKEMLSVWRDGDVTRVKINSSSLSIIQECSRKALYSLKEKWSGTDEAPATVYGSAIHKALEVFYQGAIEERKLPALNEIELMSYGHSVEGEETDLILRSVRAFVNKAQPLAILPESDKRSLQTGVWLLWNYFKTYLNDPYVAYVDETGPFVERGFEFRLYESEKLSIDYFGTIDLVVKNVHTGAILVADHKTSSVVGNDFFNRLRPNHQYTGYLLGARTVFGLQTNEFVVNCLQVKAQPKTARGLPPHFPRQVTTRDESDFEEFKDAVIHAVVSYLAALKANVWTIGHVNNCAMYGGCKYLSICSSPKQMRENILAAKFVKGEVYEIK